MRSNQQFKEWYGEDFYAVVDAYKEEFETYRDEFEKLMLVNYGEIHQTPEELNSNIYFVK